MYRWKRTRAKTSGIVCSFLPEMRTANCSSCAQLLFVRPRTRAEPHSHFSTRQNYLQCEEEGKRTNCFCRRGEEINFYLDIIKKYFAIKCNHNFYQTRFFSIAHVLVIIYVAKQRKWLQSHSAIFSRKCHFRQKPNKITLPNLTEVLSARRKSGSTSVNAAVPSHLCRHCGTTPDLYRPWHV